jgi:hypothetical protein
MYASASTLALRELAQAGKRREDVHLHAFSSDPAFFRERIFA